MLVTYAVNNSYTNEFGMSRAQLIDAFLGVPIDQSTISLHKPGYFRTRTIYIAEPRPLGESTEAHMLTKLRSILDLPATKEYELFMIPKASGGFRLIQAPNVELKHKQRLLADWFRQDAKVLSHQAAHAYVQKRSAYDALYEHKQNESKWFLKVDISDFFPSITTELLKTKLRQLYPLHIPSDTTMDELLDVCTILGTLPQGAPTSPILSNLVMVEFDKVLTETLWDYNKQHFVYTRYADDLLISSKYNFDYHGIIEVIEQILRDSAYSLRINVAKTRYGSSSGSNWNLGLMLNKDGNITVGSRRKKRIRAMVNDVMTTPVGEVTVEFAQEVQGQLAYLKYIEPNAYENLMQYYLNKMRKHPADVLVEIIRGNI